MQPEGSFLCSPEPATSLYCKPGEPRQYYLPNYDLVSQAVSCLQVFQLKFGKHILCLPRMLHPLRVLSILA
jgi:hypothetical protein